MTLFIIAIVLFVLFTGLVKIRATDNGKHTDIQFVIDDLKAKAMAQKAAQQVGTFTSKTFVRTSQEAKAEAKADA